MPVTSGAHYRFGPYSLDAVRRSLSRDGERVQMTSRAFDVLLALVDRAGETVDKDELLRVVWPGAIVEESNLTQQIFTIRRLLGPSPAPHEYVVTVPRRGYRFVAPVTRATVGPLSEPGRDAGPDRRQNICLTMTLPVDAPLALVAERALTISPDGRAIVYVAGGAAGPRLYRRLLESFEATPIPATEGAGNPFFSPDGEWVGFTAGRKLQRVPLRGGPLQTICALPSDVRGATWTPSGVIVFGAGPASALWQVPADGGGPPRPLTTLRFEQGERTHRWPHLLPDGVGVLFTVGHVHASSFDEASLAVVDLHDPDHRIVLYGATDGRCSDARTLLCGRHGTLLTATFDPERRQVMSALRGVLTDVVMSPTGAVHAASSATGVLVHAPGPVQSPGRSLLTVARDATRVEAATCEDSIEEPRVSADGRSVVVSRRGRGSDLWLYDRVRQAFRRLTFDEKSFAGIWGPANSTVTCSSSSGGIADLYCLEPGRGGEPTLLLQTDFDKVPGAWSPDGGALAFTEYHHDTGADIWTFEPATGATRPLVRTRFNEYGPSISPDGRHVAYTSDESGRPEVYVVSLPDGSGKCQISSDGGAEPVWSPDGQELFYRVGHRMMRADVSRGPHLSGVPTTLFEHRHVPGVVTGLANYDVVPERSEFMVVVEQEVPAIMRLHVTLER